MKLAILSRNTKLYSTRRLVEAARLKGHSVRALDPLRCYMRIASDGFAMHYKGKEISGYHVVIPRIGASVTRYGTAVLRQFELMGSYSPNSSDAILRARDKLRSHQLLAAQAIGMPATVFGDNPDDTVDLLLMLGPPPHVVKLNEGTQGAGVMLTEKLSASRGVIEALRGLYAQFLVQEFIPEAKGADLRCFVVGGKVVAAMKRQAPVGDFRSNLHRGGTARGVKATLAEQEVAIRAARVLGLGVAGVDLIRSHRGPLVLEVNSSPGLEGIEDASGIDVAGEIIDYVAQRYQRRLAKQIALKPVTPRSGNARSRLPSASSRHGAAKAPDTAPELGKKSVSKSVAPNAVASKRVVAKVPVAKSAMSEKAMIAKRSKPV